MVPLVSCVGAVFAWGGGGNKCCKAGLQKNCFSEIGQKCVGHILDAVQCDQIRLYLKGNRNIRGNFGSF